MLQETEVGGFRRVWVHFPGCLADETMSFCFCGRPCFKDLKWSVMKEYTWHCPLIFMWAHEHSCANNNNNNNTHTPHRERSGEVLKYYRRPEDRGKQKMVAQMMRRRINRKSSTVGVRWREVCLSNLINEGLGLEMVRWLIHITFAVLLSTSLRWLSS